MGKISKEDARYRLCMRAVGIGEDHVNSAGRKFAIELILQGVVKALFLECPSSDQGELNRVLELPRESAAFREGIKIINGPAGRPNEIPLYYVAVSAWDHVIPIFLLDWDTQTMKHLAVRDAHAAERFRCATQIMGGHGVGCLILYGAMHFMGDEQFYGQSPCLADLLDPLDWVPLTGHTQYDRI